ncbi:MAG: TlpA disulfide reductase family protein [Proteobacteria bacterium]|nr:TlpA disulfide reductase family protein [Pseudomonadota bacterium]
MKRYLWAAVAVVALASASPAAGLAAVPESGPPAFQGSNRPFTLFVPVDPAPAAPVYTLNGGVTTLNRFSGKVVVLNIWATWCPACLHELPTLANLQSRMGRDQFTVVALSIDDGGAAVVSRYLRRNGLENLPAYLDPAGRVLTALNVGTSLPVSFLIDHQGRVVGYMKGAADWSSPQAKALIDYYISRISP